MTDTLDRNVSGDVTPGISADGTVTSASGAQAPVGHTLIPVRDDTPVGPRRAIRGAPLEEKFNLWGAAAAGVSVAFLLFGWFAPLTGQVGMAVVAFLAFLLFYAMLLGLKSNRLEIQDRIMITLLFSAGTILVGALSFVVVFTLIRGQEALVHPNFFYQTMETAGPLDPLDVGGIFHAIMGTLMQITMALALAIPLGITTAVFLNEIGGPFARFVRTISDAMTALPSIVAGLFVYAAIITLITHQRSGFAASLAITVMMLPIIIRASDVVLRLVAGNLREASYALGTTRWRTVWHVVLPTARSGLVTAVILGTARGIGETSPVLLTSGVTAVLNLNPFEGPMISLPLQVFDFVKSPEPNMVARGFGAAAVLLLLVLTLFAIARLIGGKGPGQLSARQQKALLAQSSRDQQRMTIAADRREREEARQRQIEEEYRRGLVAAGLPLPEEEPAPVASAPVKTGPRTFVPANARAAGAATSSVSAGVAASVAAASAAAAAVVVADPAAATAAPVAVDPAAVTAAPVAVDPAAVTPAVAPSSLEPATPVGPAVFEQTSVLPAQEFPAPDVVSQDAPAHDVTSVFAPLLDEEDDAEASAHDDADDLDETKTRGALFGKFFSRKPEAGNEPVAELATTAAAETDATEAAEVPSLAAWLGLSPEPESEPETEAVTESEPEPVIKPEPEATAEIETETSAEPQAETQSAVEPEQPEVNTPGPEIPIIKPWEPAPQPQPRDGFTPWSFPTPEAPSPDTKENPE
jgi:phosphate transport system permease protein